jgi:ferredoxin
VSGENGIRPNGEVASERGRPQAASPDARTPVPTTVARLEARLAFGRQAEPVPFTLDGVAVTAQPGETLLQAAARYDVHVPHLCYTEGMRPDGNCRACMVEVAGERVLAPSCCRYPTAGMSVSTLSERALLAQRFVI